jgi:hypothetical protein
MRVAFTSSQMLMAECGPELEVGVAEPMAQLGDLAAVAIVQMLPGAKDFHGGNARLHGLVQPGNSQAMVHAHVRG